MKAVSDSISRKWYYATLKAGSRSDREQYGPVDEAELVQKIINHKIPKGTVVWSEGMDEWVAIENSRLKQYIPQDMPPPLKNPPPLNTNGNLASFKDRLIAGSIDFLILLVPSIIVATVIPIIGWVLAGAAYYIYFMSENGDGRTVGYRAMNLRLVNENNQSSIAIKDAALWYLLFSGVGLIGWILFFTDERKRMLHNIISNTIVIKES